MEKDNETKHAVVQTYVKDMAKVIEGSEGGLIKKIIHQEEEHEKEKISLSPESKKNKFFMLSSLALVFVTLVILAFFIFRKDAPAVPIAEQFAPIVFTDRSAFIEVKGFDKDEIAQMVASGVDATTVKEGGVEGIYLSLDKKVVGLREFMALIEGNFIFGDILGDTGFVEDDFLLGVASGETKDFFMLIKMRSIFDIFESLRAWEAKIFSDLHGFFGMNITPETKYLLTAPFEDGLVENKNARILYDTDKKIVLMYIFANDNSIVITNTEEAASEIMRRLMGSKVEK